MSGVPLELAADGSTVSLFAHLEFHSKKGNLTLGQVYFAF
jgi:hypothetical protein